MGGFGWVEDGWQWVGVGWVDRWVDRWVRGYWWLCEWLAGWVGGWLVGWTVSNECVMGGFELAALFCLTHV